MQILLIVLGCALVAGLIFWRLRRKPGESSDAGHGPAEGSAKIDAEQEALYALGMHPGEDGSPLVYALQTCQHCRKAREFLEKNEIPFHLLYVDLFSGEHRTNLMDKLRVYNPRGSFPTIVLPNGRVVVGFREQLLREALFHDTEGTA